MKIKLLILLTLCILFSYQFAYTKTSNSPFSSKTQEFKTSSQRNIPIWRTFAKYQRKGTSIISRNIRSLKNKFNLGVLLWIILFSFGYGVFHAIGPGHGKAIVGLYFLHKKARLIDAGKIAFIVAFTHTGLALILAILFQTILSALRGMGRIQVQNYFNIASGILITLVGFWLLYDKIRKKETQAINRNINMDKNIYAIGISAGIIPCPISLTIMLITISLGLFFVGFVAILAMSVGLSLVLFVIGFLIMRSRKEILCRLENNSRLVKILTTIISYIGAVGIILLGLFISIIYLSVIF